MTKSNQSEIHAAMIARIKRVLTSRQWILRFEELHADIVAFLPGKPGVWALEAERRGNAYWIRRNESRDNRNGACGIIFVTESTAVAQKVRKILSAGPSDVATKAIVVTIDDFSEEFVRNVMEGRS